VKDRLANTGKGASLDESLAAAQKKLFDVPERPPTPSTGPPSSWWATAALPGGAGRAQLARGEREAEEGLALLLQAGGGPPVIMIGPSARGDLPSRRRHRAMDKRASSLGKRALAQLSMVAEAPMH
jgi:hypothetical protein